MSDSGPSAAELGITARDIGLEEQKNSSRVILPSSVEGTVFVQKQDPDDPMTQHYEAAPYKFQREQELPPQEQFSDKTKNMVLAPIRGELDNGNLANFLRQLNDQKGFDSQDKLGLVLLINDNAKDRDEGKGVVDENRMVSRYVSLLSSKDREGIGQLDIPEEYKDLAKEIIDKDKLEIRQDFLHAEDTSTHFGALRLNLFKDARAFKNNSLPDNEAVLHLSDVDATYASSHFQTLRNFYMDPSHEANLSEQDFLPGVHEGEKEEDISRDLLSHIDEFRLFNYGKETAELLSGRVASGTPMISGRLPYFEGKNLDEHISTLDTNEDYKIGKKMRDSERLGKAVGNVGEVYRGHRARTVRDPSMMTDATEAFTITEMITKGESVPSLGVGDYNLSTEGDKYIDNLESQVARAQSRAGDQDDHSENFKESDEYRELLQAELRDEQAKVRLRRMRLMGYADSLTASNAGASGGQGMSDTEQKIADPYIEYFQDETDEMKRQLAEGKTSDQVAVSYIHKYDSFFNPDTPIHNQIARVRALKKYAFAHDLEKQKDWGNHNPLL